MTGLLAVSCPYDLFDLLARWSEAFDLLLCSLCINSHVAFLLLMLSGDIELNPGPITPAPSPGPTLQTIHDAISRLEQTQSSVLTELTLIRAAQSNTDNLVSRLVARVDKLEKAVEARQVLSPGENPVTDSAILKLSSEVKILTEKCDDSENRLRRCNLIFFGLPDTDGETWGQSESKILSFCSEKLGVTLDSKNIERAHRLGRFHGNKNRPIIVKFSHFKDKSSVISCNGKLKNTSFVIREDYSARVRLARRKLFHYAQEKNLAFKIRFDKLIVGNKQYTYDSATDAVIELQS